LLERFREALQEPRYDQRQFHPLAFLTLEDVQLLDASLQIFLHASSPYVLRDMDDLQP
jgi:hypothetical protein